MRGQNILRGVAISVLCLAAVDAQLDWVKEKWEDMSEKLGEDRMKQYGADAWRKMKEKYNKLLDSLPEGIRDKLKNENWNNVTAADLTANVPKDALNKMNPDQFLSLKPDEFKKLLNSDKLNNRMKGKLQQLQAASMTPEEALAAFNDNKNKRGMRMQLVKAIGDPTDWLVADVDKYVDQLFFVPQLSKVKDAMANRRIFEIIKFCLDEHDRDTDSASCDRLKTPTGRPTRAALGRARTHMLKGFGDPKDYTADTLETIGEEFLSAEQLDLVKPSVIKTRLTALNNEEFTKNPRIGKVIVQKILDDANVKQMTSKTDVNAVTATIEGFLKDHISPEMLPDLDYSGLALGETLKVNRNARINMGIATPKETQKMFGDQMKMSLTEPGTSVDGKFGMMVPASKIKEAFDRGIMDEDALVEVFKMDKKPGRKSKMRKFASMFLNSKKSGGKLSATNVPDEIASFVAAEDLKSMDVSQRKLMSMKRNARFDNSQKSALIKDATAASLKDFSPEVKYNIPLDQVSTASPNDLNLLVNDLDSGAPISSFAMEKSLTGAEIDEFDINDAVARHMTTSHVEKIKQEDIDDVLEKIRDTKQMPQQSTCRALKNKMVERFMSETVAADDEEVSAMLGLDDIENTPICVLAALGSENLKKVDNDGKIMMLESLSEVGSTLSIPKATRKTIVAEGLKAQGKTSGGLNADQVDFLENLCSDAPTDMLEDTVDGEAIYAIVTSLNEEFSRPSRPCLHRSELSAISTLVKRYLGDLSMVDPEKLQEVCCLLFTFSASDASRINPNTIISCVCERGDEVPQFSSRRMASCKAETDGTAATELGEQNLQTIQARGMVDLYNDAMAMSSDRRRKRQASGSDTLSTCDIAQIQGANALSSGQIEDLEYDVMMDCLDDLTSLELVDDKCQRILKKLKSGSDDLKDLNASQMKKLGYLMKCFQEADVEALPKIEDVSVIGSMGKKMDLDDDLLEALAKKVTGNYKTASAFSFEDIHAMGELMCGLEEDDISSLSAVEMRKSMSTIGTLDGCEDEQLAAYATKAIDVYGSVEDWEASTLSECGIVIAGVSPEDFKKIPAKSTTSLTPKAMEKMPKDTANSITLDQLKSFQTSTLQSITSEQKSGFNDEMMDIMDKLLGDSKGNTATRLASPVTAMTLVLVSTMIACLI